MDLPTLTSSIDFPPIADLLINKRILLINDTPYRITEIEFYLMTSKHPDEFCHCCDLQGTTGQWYFHRAGKNGAYRGGTRKGFDITLGSEECHGAALIRSISSLDSKIKIEGPSKIVDYILLKTGHSDIASLVKSGEGLILQMRDLEKKEIYSSPRVGLSLKKPTANKYQYVMVPYRFLTCPREITKGKNTFALSLHRGGHSSKEISVITGIRETFICRYIEQYTRGQGMSVDMKETRELKTVEEINMLYGSLSHLID